MSRTTAKIDKWGKVRIPSEFLKDFKKNFGNEVFMTSLDDKNMQIYPLATWHELADNINKTKKDDPLLRRFLMKTSYKGQRARIDKYGRVQIPGSLRKKIKFEGEIAIDEKEGHLELKLAQRKA